MIVQRKGRGSSGLGERHSLTIDGREKKVSGKRPYSYATEAQAGPSKRLQRHHPGRTPLSVEPCSDGLAVGLSFWV